VHAKRMSAQETLRVYGEVLNKQLKTVLESTITEDTMNQEMGIAAQAHRDGIHMMTAIPPLIMDENMLQLQTRCAAAEEKAEDLRIELQARQGQNAEGKIASLQRDLEKSRTKIEETQEKLMEQTDLNEARI
jgi:hypothetical protein